jgi:hypothetical protein
MDDLLRVYLDPAEIGLHGYPYAWYGRHPMDTGQGPPPPAIKDVVREQAGHRCVRCDHPYRKGEHGRGEWSPCDKHCTHGGPIREAFLDDVDDVYLTEAQWRILTVHHLNGIKHDCRWWNLAALCQRCHLSIQTRVVMECEYVREHSDWFKPYVAGFYSWKYLGEEITRIQALARLDDLLALEQRQDRLPL